MAERLAQELGRHAALAGFRATALRFAAPLGGVDPIFRAEMVLEGISDIHPIIQADPFAGRADAEGSWLRGGRQNLTDRTSGRPHRQADSLRQRGDASTSAAPADTAAPGPSTRADRGGRGAGGKQQLGRRGIAPHPGSGPLPLRGRAADVRPIGTALPGESDRRLGSDSSGGNASQLESERRVPARALNGGDSSPPPASGAIGASAQAIDLLRAAFARMEQATAVHTDSATTRRILAGQGTRRPADGLGSFESRRATSGVSRSLARQSPPTIDSAGAGGRAIASRGDDHSTIISMRSAPPAPTSDLTEGHRLSGFVRRPGSMAHRPHSGLSTIARLDELLRGSLPGGEQPAGLVALPGASPSRQYTPGDRAGSSDPALRPEPISAPSAADASNGRDLRPAPRKFATRRDLYPANPSDFSAPAAKQPRGEARIDSETLIDLVNEALIRQARRHGVDLL